MKHTRNEHHLVASKFYRNLGSNPSVYHLRYFSWYIFFIKINQIFKHIKIQSVRLSKHTPSINTIQFRTTFYYISNFILVILYIDKKMDLPIYILLWFSVCLISKMEIEWKIRIFPKWSSSKSNDKNSKNPETRLLKRPNKRTQKKKIGIKRSRQTNKLQIKKTFHVNI